MQNNNMQFLTISEAAEYLRMKERKLYELVSEGAIPCTKITGRWLFPRAELNRWLSSSISRPGGMADSEPPPIIGGSHDSLLEWALRESGCGLASLAEGSAAGLNRLAESGVVAAAIHMHALDDKSDANVQAVLSLRELHDAVLIGFLRREQGLLVRAGNPKKIRSLADAVKSKAVFAKRPEGAGAHLLLLSLLHKSNIPLEKLSLVQPPCPTGADVAQAIRAGRADCGIATRSVAGTVGLDFVPLLWEQFDIAVRARDYFRKPMQSLLTFLRQPAFAARAKELGGYEISAAGSVRYAP